MFFCEKQLRSRFLRVLQTPSGVFVKGLLMCVLIVPSGCAKFRSSTRIDLTPFAENMVAIAGDIQYSLEQEEVIYIRDLLVGPEVDSARAMNDKVGAILRGTVAYSMELVTLTQSGLSGSEQTDLLATYLDGAIRPAIQQPSPELYLTLTQFDAILDDVRAQDDLLKALGTAQPIVTEVARVAGEIVEQTRDAIDDAVAKIEQQIIDEYKDLNAMKRRLRDEQVESMMNLSFLTDYRSGEAAALDSLLAREPSLQEVIPSAERISVQDIKAIEERMLHKLSVLRDLRAQLVPDLELYWSKQLELTRLVTTYHANLRKARVTFIVWAQAHQRLAAGITDPAKINVLGLARAAGGMLPPLR